MRFSQYSSISREADRSWFDPILSLDTRLCLDPFLAHDLEEGVFQSPLR